VPRNIFGKEMMVAERITRPIRPTFQSQRVTKDAQKDFPGSNINTFEPYNPASGIGLRSELEQVGAEATFATLQEAERQEVELFAAAHQAEQYLPIRQTLVDSTLARRLAYREERAEREAQEARAMVGRAEADHFTPVRSETYTPTEPATRTATSKKAQAELEQVRALQEANARIMRKFRK
jgi:hypothetical protein